MNLESVLNFIREQASAEYKQSAEAVANAVGVLQSSPCFTLILFMSIEL